MIFQRLMWPSFHKSFVLLRKLSRLQPEPLQCTYRATLGITGEMGIPQGHSNVLISHQFFRGWEINTRHDQTAGKHVPQIMKSEVRNYRSPNSAFKRCPEGAVRSAFSTTKDKAYYR
jgi:hypothetical protein